MNSLSIADLQALRAYCAQQGAAAKAESNFTKAANLDRIRAMAEDELDARLTAY